VGQAHLAITRGEVWIPSPSDSGATRKAAASTHPSGASRFPRSHITCPLHKTPARRQSYSFPESRRPPKRASSPSPRLSSLVQTVLRHARLVRKTARASMHPFSVLTLGIFVAGYITARWDLVTRLCELAIFAWEYGVVVSRPPEPCSTPRPRTRTGNSLLTVGIRADSRRESLPRAHPCVPPHIHPCGTSCDPGGEFGTTAHHLRCSTWY
jgi:hypothetical protein